MPKLIHKDPYIRVPQWHEKIPKEVQPFKYKKLKTPRVTHRVGRPMGTPEELLSGYVHGEKASKLEERFAIALDFFGLTYQFQYEVPSIYSLPGEEKNIDFLVYDGGIAWPIEVGASFVHDTTSEKDAELARTALINAILPMLGIMQITDDSYIEYDKPESIEEAKDIVSSLFISI